jgi:hypothetical protein
MTKLAGNTTRCVSLNTGARKAQRKLSTISNNDKLFPFYKQFPETVARKSFCPHEGNPTGKNCVQYTRNLPLLQHARLQRNLNSEKKCFLKQTTTYGSMQEMVSNMNSLPLTSSHGTRCVTTSRPTHVGVPVRTSLEAHGQYRAGTGCPKDPTLKSHVTQHRHVDSGSQTRDRPLLQHTPGSKRTNQRDHQMKWPGTRTYQSLELTGHVCEISGSQGEQFEYDYVLSCCTWCSVIEATDVSVMSAASIIRAISTHEASLTT